MKKIINITTLLIFLLSISFSMYSFAAENDEFKFNKANYTFIGEDSEFIEMTLPSKYSLKDVTFTSQDPDIADIEIYSYPTFYDVAIIGKKVGNTKITATIKDTDYTTSATVSISNPISFKLGKQDPTSGKAVLTIENTNNLYWSYDTLQAVELQVIPFNTGTPGEWTRLGKEDIYGAALNKSYSYEVTENCVINVRHISWWKGTSDESVLAENSFIINTLEPTASIMARLKIVNKAKKDFISIGDTIQFDTDLIEISEEEKENVQWRSYNSDIATIDENGKLTALASGIVRIEASLDEYNDIYVVYVDPVFTINSSEELAKKSGAVNIKCPTRLNTGKTGLLSLHTKSVGAVYTSSNPDVASIDDKGQITAKSAGKTTFSITITGADKNYSVTKELEVVGSNPNPSPSPSPSQSPSQAPAAQQKKAPVDDTVAKGKLPNTGLASILAILVVFALVICVICYVPSRETDD